jgi:hypothetical protein
MVPSVHHRVVAGGAKLASHAPVVDTASEFAAVHFAAALTCRLRAPSDGAAAVESQTLADTKDRWLTAFT